MMTTLLFSCSDDSQFKFAANFQNKHGVKEGESYKYENNTMYLTRQIDAEFYQAIKTCEEDETCKASVAETWIEEQKQALAQGNVVAGLLCDLYKCGKKWVEVYENKETGERIEVEYPLDWTAGLDN